MWLRVLLAGGLLAGLLSACAVVDPVDRRYDTIGRSLAKARDEAIFLNLVRASHDYPLAFTTIANVTPSMSNTTSFALPSFSLGPANCLPSFGPTGVLTGRACSLPTGFGGADVGVSNSTASNATAISTNFNVATQETGSFYDGFLKPIDLQTLDYFIRQDYPRELLFWLFADSFQLTEGTHDLGYQYQPPTTYGCPETDKRQMCFREWVWVAVLTGLTVEEKSIVKASSAAGGGRSSDSAKSSDPSGGGSKGGKAETIVVARFCFSDVLEHQAQVAMGRALATEMAAKYLNFPFSPSPRCGTWTDAQAQADSEKPQPDTFDFNVGPLKFRVVPRSAYGVFEFLGTVIKMETQGLVPSDHAYLPPAPRGRPDEADPPRLLTTDNSRLLDIELNGGGDCFSHTYFYDGDYCVPEAATNTKRIFSLLAQLIAIETQASDLSITPVVRVIQ
jgi:hypothetical protein